MVESAEKSGKVSPKFGMSCSLSASASQCTLPEAYAVRAHVSTASWLQWGVATVHDFPFSTRLGKREFTALPARS